MVGASPPTRCVGESVVSSPVAPPRSRAPGTVDVVFRRPDLGASPIEEERPDLLTRITDAASGGEASDQFAIGPPPLHRWLALQNAFDESETALLTARCGGRGDKIKYCAELKIDGPPISLTYSEGSSGGGNAATGRWRGRHRHVRTIRSVPAEHHASRGLARRLRSGGRGLLPMPHLKS